MPTCGKHCGHVDNFLSYVKQKDKKDRNQGNTDFVHKKKLMHRKLSTGVYNFGEKYEKINGFSMFPNICFVYNLHEGEKG